MKKIAFLLIMVVGIGMISCKPNKTEEPSGTVVDSATTVTDSVPEVKDSVVPSTDSVAPTADSVPKK